MAILSVSAMLVVLGMNFIKPQPQATQIDNPPEISFEINQDPIARINPKPIADCPKPAIAPKPAKLKPSIYHLRYTEASNSDLVAVGNDQLLHRDAAQALRLMQQAASKDRVSINVISGFRSISDQAGIVRDKEYRGLSDAAIYNQSAAAGYSEHHTGYAFDANSLESSFGDTKTGKWLRANSLNFGFEMSFDKGNVQNIAYEPWHFRYIGTPEAVKTFCYASSLKQK
jgi:LAS superfamily LD-carboxypeptidase LdcB